MGRRRDNLPGTSIPEPTGWPTIKTTYDQSILAKLQSRASSNATTDRKLKLAAIDYWIARLQLDRYRISQGLAPDP
jgi:hypothetical protein